MTRFLSDTLTEASDKLLSSHTPGTGGAWTLFSTPTMTVLAAEGRARGSDVATTSIYYNGGTATANMSVAATVRRTTTTVNESFTGVAARLQTTSGADSRYVLYHSGAQLILQKRVAATASTTLAAVTLSYPVDTDCTIELRVNGSELIGLWNGSPQIAVSDSSISGAGYAGMTCRLNGRIDSITADTIAWDVAPADGAHGSGSDASAVGVSYSLAPADGTHAASSDAAGVGWAGSLAPGDGGHAVSSDAAGVGWAGGLAPGDAGHAVSSDAAGLGWAGAVSPSDGGHGISSDAAAIGWRGALAPADGAHGMTSDGAAVAVVSLSPPGAGIALPVGGDARAERIGRDQREEGIHHG